jgi:hypothetical protein
MEDTIMISEALLSKGHTSFWSEFTPWLNSYTQIINKRYLAQPYGSFQDTDDPKHRSINGIISFNYFMQWSLNRKPLINEVLELSKKEIERFPRNNLSEYSLDPTNMKIVESMALRMKTTFSEELMFHPFFPGCGILSNCEGDLLSKKTLVEIKTGDRQILPSDIRQLIIYAVLNHLADDVYEIKDISYFNPRKGTLWHIDIQDLLSSICNLSLSDFSYEMENYLISQSQDFNPN